MMKTFIKLLAIALLPCMIVGAEDNFSFNTQQACAIECASGQTYYVLVYDFDTLTAQWSGALNTHQMHPYSLPADSWVGIYIYDADSTTYTYAQYAYRHDDSPTLKAQRPSAARNPNNVFSSGNSVVSVDCQLPEGWLYTYYFGTGESDWRSLGQESAYSQKFSLPAFGDWAGMYLYDFETSTFEDEVFYVSVESLY